MRTTVDIPDDLLKKVMHWSKAKTRSEAIRTALAEYVRREAVEALIAMAGTRPDFPDVHEELERIEMEEHGPVGTRRFLEEEEDLSGESQTPRPAKVS